MKVLVGCEFSGIVRDAFAQRGHDTISCDFLDSEKESGKHYKGDVLDILDDGWDLAIFHPPCTYLANSGVRWLHEREGRWEEMLRAVEFFNTLLRAKIPKICIENPIQHKYALQRIIRGYDQIIQPWQFGHGETKATCLWLKGLQMLEPTKVVEGRKQRVYLEPRTSDRWKNRSRTYQGIADAMAEQFGNPKRIMIRQVNVSDA